TIGTVSTRVTLRTLGTVLTVSTRVTLRPLLARIALGSLQRRKPLGLGTRETVSNRDVVGAGTIGTRLTLRPLRRLSSTGSLDTVQLSRRNRRATSLPVLPLVRLESHSHSPPG